MVLSSDRDRTLADRRLSSVYRRVLGQVISRCTIVNARETSERLVLLLPFLLLE